MDTHAAGLLAAYCAAVVAASLFGAWLPTAIRVTHTRVQTAMSLAAGFIVGVALFHLMPHGFASLAGADAAEVVAWWMTLGVVAMLLLLRLGHFHRHDVTDDGEDAAIGAKPFAWAGIAIGLSIHALVEGAALGASVSSAPPLGAIGLAGAGVFVAIFLHKPLDALSIAGMMQVAGVGRRIQVVTNVAFAALCPIGAFLVLLGTFGPMDGEAIGRVLAFAAGAFLCIALADILPEVHFHSHDRVLLTTVFVVGVAGAWGLHLMEAAAHGH